MGRSPEKSSACISRKVEMEHERFSPHLLVLQLQAMRHLHPDKMKTNLPMLRPNATKRGWPIASPCGEIYYYIIQGRGVGGVIRFSLPSPPPHLSCLKSECC